MVALNFFLKLTDMNLDCNFFSVRARVLLKCVASRFIVPSGKHRCVLKCIWVTQFKVRKFTRIEENFCAEKFGLEVVLLYPLARPCTHRKVSEVGQGLIESIKVKLGFLWIQLMFFFHFWKVQFYLEIAVRIRIFFKSQNQNIS